MKNLERIDKTQIPDNELNRKLINLYKELPQAIVQEIESYNSSDKLPKITNPWLLCATNDYAYAKRKIMLIGQESLGWLGEMNDGAFSRINIPLRLMKLYHLFVNDGGYNSPIWHFYRKLNRIANENDAAIIMNNIGKAGYIRPNRGFESQVNRLFNDVFKKEIELCAPDLIIFLTGPRYDDSIKERLGSFTLGSCLDKINTRQLARLKFDDSILKSSEIYRTYHPAYLQRKNKQKWVKQIYQFLFDLVEKH